jgi:HSP20 family protein
MSTFDQVRHGLHQALDSLAEGWHAFKRRASHALTHFAPQGGEAGGPEAALVHGSARWGVLAAELREEDDRILVNLEVPGMEAGDFDIEVVEDLLVIRGEKRVEREDTGGGRYFLLERAYGAFERAIHLPAEVEQDRAEANYRRGVLSVSLPKRNRHWSRRVSVDVG